MKAIPLTFLYTTAKENKNGKIVNKVIKMIHLFEWHKKIIYANFSICQFSICFSIWFSIFLAK